MSQIDRRVDSPLVDWSDLGVSGLLPTGTVTLLLADVEGSTRLWETQPEKMTAAIAALGRTATGLIAAYGGVRPLEQGEGDSFVAAFSRASDAVACALDLQRAPLAPIRLRLGVHTGEIRLRDDANYAGPTINRTARLRDLAHGGQTVLSGATEPLVVDRLRPSATWCASSVRDTVIRRSPPVSSFSAHRADSPHPRLRQAQPELPRPTRPGSSSPHITTVPGGRTRPRVFKQLVCARDVLGSDRSRRTDLS